MSERDTMTTIWRSPGSLWLKASAAAVRGYDPIRADLWMDLARDLERREARRLRDTHHVRQVHGPLVKDATA